MNVRYEWSLYLVPFYSEVMIIFYIFPVGKNKLKLNPVKYENMLPHFISQSNCNKWSNSQGWNIIRIQMKFLDVIALSIF